jgi:hypothetical protein
MAQSIDDLIKQVEGMSPEERILASAAGELGLDRKPIDPSTLNTSNVGKLNIYTCRECRGHVVTRDLEAGVTPFMVGCKATAGCKGMMESSFYRVWDQKMRASHVWYRPVSTGFLTAGERQHVEMGGLLLREAAAGDAS